MNYHLLLNGQQAGPYTIGQLKSMWSTGSITSQTLYWTEGMAEWIPLGDYLEGPPPARGPGPIRHTASGPVVATQDANQEKPIGTGESLVICLFSLLFNILAIIIGVVLLLTGKKKRGGRLIFWGVFWGVILLLYILVGGPI